MEKEVYFLIVYFPIHLIRFSFSSLIASITLHPLFHVV